jgi:hypothetical protein
VTVTVDALDRIELPPVPIGIVQAGDLAGVVQEAVGIADGGPERELIDDVGFRVPVVVDV